MKRAPTEYRSTAGRRPLSPNRFGGPPPTREETSHGAVEPTLRPGSRLGQNRPGPPPAVPHLARTRAPALRVVPPHLGRPRLPAAAFGGEAPRLLLQLRFPARRPRQPHRLLLGR